MLQDMLNSASGDVGVTTKAARVWLASSSMREAAKKQATEIADLKKTLADLKAQSEKGLSAASEKHAATVKELNEKVSELERVGTEQWEKVEASERQLATTTAELEAS